MSTYLIREIIGLDGMVMARSTFDLPGYGASWRFVQTEISERFGCSPDDVHAEEPDEDDDDQTTEWVIADGARVARVRDSFADPAARAALIFADELPQAAE